jgi:hypothetical protein
MEVKPGTQVYLIENVISSDFCETIKYIIDNTDGTTEEYGDRSNVQAKMVVKGDICKRTSIKFADLIDNEIYKIVTNVITKVIDINSFIHSISGDSGYQLRKIHGPTRRHIDDIFSAYESKSIRKLSLIIALNEDYDGGEFHFPEQSLKIKLKKGQALLFPPYWTHPHQTNELLNNTFRYTINTWLLN